MHEPAALRSIVYDNLSGARELTQRTLALLEQSTAESVAATPGRLLDELADVGVKVIRSKPEMPQLLHALNRVLLAAEAQESPTVPFADFRAAVLRALNEEQQSLRTRLERVAEALQPLLPNGCVVVTCSRSSTVLAGLRRAKKEGKLFDVIVSESRPNLEGRNLARELSADAIPVRLVVDALLATAVEGADRVLVGADAVTTHGVVNKVGTRVLALAAREAGVPVTVVAESDKTWVKRLDPGLGLLTGRPREPKEVWDAAPYGVEIVNLYFERTPLDLVTNIVGEDGVHAPPEHWRHVAQRGYARRVRDAFADELV